MATAARAAPVAAPVAVAPAASVPRRAAGGSTPRLAPLKAASAASAPPALRAVLAVDAGEPLRLPLRQALERGLRTELTAVRVHRSEAAQRMVAASQARAMTLGADIFLGPGESDTDVALLAHETAHVVQQQGAAPVLQPLALAGRGDALERDADRAAAVVVSGGSTVVASRTAPRPQGGLGDWVRRGVSAVADVVGDIAGAALNFIRDHARVIPGYDMVALILGRDPITQQTVERNPVNIIRAFMGLWPGGSLVFDALQRYGIVDRVGAWLTQQIAALGRIVGGIRTALDRFIDTLGPGDIVHLGDVWERARRIFSVPIDQATSFVRNLAADVLQFIRDAVLRPIARLAEGTRAYDLLRLVLGRDPITGDPYPRTPENLIGGFMRLIGQEEKWRQLQESRAIPRAWAWFQQQMAALLGFVSEVPGLFLAALRSLSVGDLLDLGGAFGRMRQIFGGFVSRFLSWAGAAAYEIMMFIFEVLAPGAMPVLRRAAAVFRIIIGDPIRFVGNLVRAGIQGFRQFLANILRHLLNGLVGWLTGALAGAGLTLPTTWDLRGVLSLVLQILGLTWQNIRTKLVRVLGERVVATLETTFDIVMTLVREGPAAAWQRILEQLGNLRDMVFGQIREWVTRTIVTQAVMRVVSMLNPAGAVIQAIIAIYNTIMFVRERLTQIIQVAESYLNAIAEIASGAIGSAANKVEETMGRLVPVVISFLARLIGLGGISDAIRNVIERIRAPIDRALDRVVDWLVAQARRIGSAVMSGARAVVRRVTSWWQARRGFSAGGEQHTLTIGGSGTNRGVILASTPTEYATAVRAMTIPANKEPNRRNALRILGLLQTAMNTAATEGPAADAAAGRIDPLLGELAAETPNFMPGAGSPSSTPPLFGGPGPGGFGSSVAVERLRSPVTEGSAPSIEGGSWNTLKLRTDGGSTYYVRGHLLNEHLGGTGAAWQNLTPLTQAANNRSPVSMLRTFETQVKDAVRAGDSVNLTVTIRYGRSARAADAARARATIVPDGDTIAQIIEAETQVPQAVSCVAYRINAAGARSALQSSTVENSLDTRLENYSIAGTPRVPLNINNAPPTALRRLNGVDAVSVTEVVNRRPYTDKDDALTKLGATLWHRIRSTAGIRVVFR